MSPSFIMFLSLYFDGSLALFICLFTISLKLYNSNSLLWMVYSSVTKRHQSPGLNGSQFLYTPTATTVMNHLPYSPPYCYGKTLNPPIKLLSPRTSKYHRPCSAPLQQAFMRILHSYYCWHFSQFSMCLPRENYYSIADKHILCTCPRCITQSCFILCNIWQQDGKIYPNMIGIKDN